jgi:MEDS: MEthanogen/methylotroph, DcmR Sensory domain
VVHEVDSGVPGIRFTPGDHVCAFHFGASERDQLVRMYLGAGMRAGDKCVGIVDGGDPAALRDSLWGEAIDGRTAGQLDVVRTDDAYLADGGFAKDEMLAFLGETVAAALGDGSFPHVRLVGEMSWVLRHPALAGELFDYESDVNEISGRHPQVLMCLYDLERFGADMLIDILRTHPKLLLGGLLIDNPNYLTPAEYRARHT